MSVPSTDANTPPLHKENVERKLTSHRPVSKRAIFLNGPEKIPTHTLQYLAKNIWSFLTHNMAFTIAALDVLLSIGKAVYPINHYYLLKKVNAYGIAGKAASALIMP